MSEQAGFFVLLIVAFLTFPVTSSGQDQAAEADSLYINKILFLPAFGSTPETGFMFGGVVMPQFKMSGAGTETRSSSILFAGIYTTKNQILLSLLPELILPREQWILSGNFFVNYFPESYWGVGADTRPEDELSILYTEINLEQAVLHQIRPSLFIGPFLRWNNISSLTFEDLDGNEIQPPEIAGSDGSRSAGFGLMGRHDRRDSNTRPTRNHFLQILVMTYPSWTGSSDPYMALSLDARKYFDLRGDRQSILAFQGLYRTISGNPPFLELSKFGGDFINRGYYGGRYRDKNIIQFQAELRQNIWGRLGFTVFAATGEVWNRYEDFNLDNYKWSAGTGLRFNINKDDPVNIRIDYGIGRNVSGFYIQFAEAF